MKKEHIDQLCKDAVGLLKELIATPSFSKEEHQTAGILTRFLGTRGIEHYRIANNVYAQNRFFDPSKPTILLNSHHDTVRPNPGYRFDPFEPVEKQGRLYGLGSNDAGGSLVSLTAVFLYYHNAQDLTHNIILAATAEEEISGHDGIERLLAALPPIDLAIVGEPTGMQMAIAEKGLLVLDCTVSGQAGHAARDEGENALYKAMADIQWFRDHRFSRVSGLLGPVRMSITVMDTENKAHNVVPSLCHFVADIRINELYSFEEILDIIERHTVASVRPRSLRMRSSIIPENHALVQAGLRLGRTCYGSPTTSDKALIPCPALKIGPGDSARSHTADEFIYLHEIKEGIELYIGMLDQILY